MSKKVGEIVIAIVIILILLGVSYYWIKYETTSDLPKKEIITNSDIKIVTSLEDEISDNSAWCGTFNLIWNDLKNDLAKQDIVFTSQLKIVENLNKGTFNTSHISEDSYYKVYGHPSQELKKEIEKAIKEKFNETSDILDDFEWEDTNIRDYFLYTMLKKEFEFKNIFTELENGTFGNYQNVKYFGIDASTDKRVKDQVIVLYYNSKDDFAIKLLTKSNDEVIIVKGNDSNTFGEMYEDIIEAAIEYNGINSFTEKDLLKIPNISFNLKKEFTELENKPFSFSNGERYSIEKAIQTIQFDLDKKGGKIKSEAGIMNRLQSVEIIDTPREFIVDDAFTIFLKEKYKDLPYFAAKISDISQVQSDIKQISSNYSKEDEQSVEQFEIRFYDKHPQWEEKTHIILDKSETEKYDYTIYAYDGSVNVLINGEELSLRNALLENKITMEEIISKANKDFINAVSYLDGGSTEYHYENYTIIKLNRLGGNRDVYIGSIDITLNDLEI